MTGSNPQLLFDLGHVPSHGADDFLPAASNAAALAWIERWPDWPGPALAIYGPAGCGKTHLARIWQARSAARAVDLAALAGAEPAALLGGGHALVMDAGAWPEGRDTSPPDEVALFHLLNWTGETRAHLLVCSRVAPARWPVRLADLRSRLAAMPAAEIGPPDETLLAALLVKLFADRQLRVPADVIQYLAARMERSCEAAGRLVAAVDAASLAAHRRVTIPLVQSVLERM
jgi:chromosomal replication initiation ATPase DnaA